MKKLDANRIINKIVGKMYLDDYGQYNTDNIDKIDYCIDSATIILKDGRYFTITISVNK